MRYPHNDEPYSPDEVIKAQKAVGINFIKRIMEDFGFERTWLALAKNSDAVIKTGPNRWNWRAFLYLRNGKVLVMERNKPEDTIWYLVSKDKAKRMLHGQTILSMSDL